MEECPKCGNDVDPTREHIVGEDSFEMKCEHCGVEIEVDAEDLGYEYYLNVYEYEEE